VKLWKFLRPFEVRESRGGEVPVRVHTHLIWRLGGRDRDRNRGGSTGLSKVVVSSRYGGSSGAHQRYTLLVTSGHPQKEASGTATSRWLSLRAKESAKGTEGRPLLLVPRGDVGEGGSHVLRSKRA
jgi:hypothetical protein